MFSFLKQSKAINLIVYDDRVQVYVWLENALTHIADFEKAPDERFQETLEEYQDFPVIIITDFLEESFRHDTGAHVSGSDRKALLERKLNYSFRNTVYRAASIVGREKEGRKDDKILLSALTKPELLEPWVKNVLDLKMRIQSVTSVAYLMEAYAQKVGLHDRHLLVVSLEQGSELRQTYLRNGKIHFSRLTSLTTKESAALPDAINHESLQIRQYLERIKLLPFESQLMVRIFSPFQLDELTMEGNSNELNVFECFNTHDLARSFALSIDGIDASATTLYLARLLQKARPGNVYAPARTRKYFHLKNTSSALIAFSSLLIVIAAAIKVPAMIDAVNNWERQTQLKEQAAPLDAQYATLSQRFPDTPIPSKEMALVVETAEHIMKNSHTPEDPMAIISRALAMAPELRITKINWTMAEKPADENYPDAAMFGTPAPANDDPAQVLQKATLKDKTILKITIEGLAYSPQSYREAQNQVQYFLTALDETPGVSVTASKMPTDVRVDTAVSTLVDNNALRAPFTLELDYEPM